MEREVRVEQEIIGHAIADAINYFIREVLIPRCLELDVVWFGPESEELTRLKYEVAASFSAKWAVSLFNDGK